MVCGYHASQAKLAPEAYLTGGFRLACQATIQDDSEDVDRRGKAFFPHAMFHDTVMSLVVVCVIVALACIWYFTSGEEAGDAAADHAAAHDRDPVAEERRCVPDRVHGRLHRAGQDGA